MGWGGVGWGGWGGVEWGGPHNVGGGADVEDPVHNLPAAAAVTGATRRPDADPPHERRGGEAARTDPQPGHDRLVVERGGGGRRRERGRGPGASGGSASGGIGMLAAAAVAALATAARGWAGRPDLVAEQRAVGGVDGVGDAPVQAEAALVHPRVRLRLPEGRLLRHRRQLLEQLRAGPPPPPVTPRTRVAGLTMDRRAARRPAARSRSGVPRHETKAVTRSREPERPRLSTAPVTTPEAARASSPHHDRRGQAIPVPRGRRT